MVDYIGKRLGNYQIISKIGVGGFAQVYLGEHMHLGTQAAIKVLHTRLDLEDVDRFRAEARTVARLIHPNIVRVLEFGIENEMPYLVMDYAPNGTLRQRHPKGAQVPLPIIVSYIKQVSAALSYAHRERLIHRDIKPANMLVGRQNEILLSDFGIALIAQSTMEQHTQDGMGTPGYMAPEQIQGKPRIASDQYSLAVIVYEWISGDLPFRGSAVEIYAQHVMAAPPSLRAIIPTLHPAVEDVILKALSKDVDQRFPSIEAFSLAFEQASQIETAPYSAPTVSVQSVNVPMPHSDPTVAAEPDPDVTPRHSAATVAAQPNFDGSSHSASIVASQPNLSTTPRLGSLTMPSNNERTIAAEADPVTSSADKESVTTGSQALMPLLPPQKRTSGQTVPLQGAFVQIWREALKAQSSGDEERAFRLLEKLISMPDLTRAQKESVSNQIMELRQMVTIFLNQAREACNQGRWQGEIAAWENLLRFRPSQQELQGQILMQDQGSLERNIRSRLGIANWNEQHAWLYEQAQQALNENDQIAALRQLERLWKDSPFYGDPANLAPTVGLPPPNNYEQALHEDLTRKQQAIERLEQENQNAVLEAEQKEREFAHRQATWKKAFEATSGAVSGGIGGIVFAILAPYLGDVPPDSLLYRFTLIVNNSLQPLNSATILLICIVLGALTGFILGSLLNPGKKVTRTVSGTTISILTWAFALPIYGEKIVGTLTIPTILAIVAGIIGFLSGGDERKGQKTNFGVGIVFAITGLIVGAIVNAFLKVQLLSDLFFLVVGVAIGVLAGRIIGKVVGSIINIFYKNEIQ